MKGLEIFFLLTKEVFLHPSCQRQGQQAEASCMKVKKIPVHPSGHVAHCVDAWKTKPNTSLHKSPFVNRFICINSLKCQTAGSEWGGKVGTGGVFASEDREVCSSSQLLRTQGGAQPEPLTQGSCTKYCFCNEN